MSSNSYNPYNYPYQQSASQQQYSSYQTASAPNNPPQASSSVSRQYQPTTQATDYGFYQAHSYGTHAPNYDGVQDKSSTWNGTNYGANRETTSRAAEVLHNMSNTTYTSNPAPNQPSFPAINTTPASRYTTAPMPSHDQSHARPPSVNTNRAQASSVRGNNSPQAISTANMSHRPAVSHSQTFNQPQRTASPAQYASSKSQYGTEHANRQLPNPASYGYSNAHVTAPISQTASATSDSIGQTTVTVDPMAVYDPWPEYQRKAESQRAQKAIEDAARLEEEKRAEQKRQEEERRKAQEEEKRRKDEEEKERKRKEEEEKMRSAQMKQTQRKDSDSQRPTGSAEAMEEEIRALMSKMREFNSKDPTLLARIWEEERKAKAPKSPTVQSRATPQAARAQTQTPPIAAPRQSAAPKEATLPKATKVAKISKATKATPAATTPITKPAEASAFNRPKGNTIWPPEKKAHLASAAASYLSARESNRTVGADEILLLLDRNPSYIELCEQLEQMGLVLDRAAFAKTLLAAVPDVNAGARPKPGLGGPVNAAQRVQVATPAVIKGAAVRTPATPVSRSQAGPQGPSTIQYPPFPKDNVPVAEMIPINPEQRRPATKEEAARKRTFNDLIDLTSMPDDEDEPVLKKHDAGIGYRPPFPSIQNAKQSHEGSPANFPLPVPPVPQPVQQLPPPELRNHALAQPLDRRNALRRNTYNIKTIARDVLLACGRHPETRQLNQHLEILRITLPQITSDADLSTLRWDLIDPGNPPIGYFKDSVHDLATDADDEDDSEDEDTRRVQQPKSSGVASTAHERALASVEAINPFKQKRRGRPPRSSLPADVALPFTPKQTHISTNMVASAPHPRKPAAGVGYSAFRSATQYDADGNPLPKKRGRPVGWRKSLHGSATALSHPNPNGRTGPQTLPTNPRLSMAGAGTNPIRIESHSPSLGPGYMSFKCKWQGCNAELHNMETLQKHVLKLHKKESSNGMLECLWDNCVDVASHDPLRNMRIESAKAFPSEKEWQEHLRQAHFKPLAWALGDGQAGGVSD